MGLQVGFLPTEVIGAQLPAGGIFVSSSDGVGLFGDVIS
jgi:hypothetical protein